MKPTTRPSPLTKQVHYPWFGEAVRLPHHRYLPVADVRPALLSGHRVPRLVRVGVREPARASRVRARLDRRDAELRGNSHNPDQPRRKGKHRLAQVQRLESQGLLARRVFRVSGGSCSRRVSGRGVCEMKNRRVFGVRVSTCCLRRKCCTAGRS